MMETHLVSVDWLAEHLTDPRVRVVDCRFVLGQPDAGRGRYNEDHIPDAVYADLERDLSGTVMTHGGRHPLPDVQELSEKLGQMGIEQTSLVVAYDEQGGAMASRFWWLLQYLGHQDVCVLDGGYPLWKASGHAVTADMPSPVPATFVPHIQPAMVVQMQDVKERAGRPGVVLIDSREAKRYQGIEELVDPVAGHIPGAVNAFWKESLTETGSWKTPEELRARFANVQADDEVIVYCGSGVTACPNILALRAAGFTNVKLYAGSWSDWVSHQENPIETTKEEG